LVAGGDGTINEALNGMVHSEVPLGILPAGTANVLANELGLGKTMERAAASFEEWTPERVAVGLIDRSADEGPRHFLLMAGAGLDADIVYHLSLGVKAALGKAAYWIGGFAKVGRRLPVFTVEAEGRKFQAGFALASRVRNYGGDLEIALGASLLDDRLELVLFEGSSSFTYLKYMLGVAARRHVRMRGITTLRTRRALFSASPQGKVHLQVDGEYAGFAPARVEIVPNALTLLVPPAFRIRDAKSAARTPADTAWTTSPTR
jgi:diacylglycerol kinase (ATP)